MPPIVSWDSVSQRPNIHRLRHGRLKGFNQTDGLRLRARSGNGGPEGPSNPLLESTVATFKGRSQQREAVLIQGRPTVDGCADAKGRRPVFTSLNQGGGALNNRVETRRSATSSNHTLCAFCFPLPSYTLRTCVWGRAPHSGPRPITGRQRVVFCMGGTKAHCARHHNTPPRAAPKPGE